MGREYTPEIPPVHPFPHKAVTTSSPLLEDPVLLPGVLALQPQELAAHQAFPFRVPWPLAQRIDWHDPDDPLRRQFWPDARETLDMPGFVRDPLGEEAQWGGQGCLHKYHGRVLVPLTAACPVHCRYCFRRHTKSAPREQGWPAILESLGTTDPLTEVILSGGDPWMLPDALLAQRILDLQALPQQPRIRLHSRVPVLLPQRMGPLTLEVLSRTPRGAVVVVHCNHPDELDSAACAAMARLRHAGVLLFNQSVLLAGINDSVPVLVRLCTLLMDQGVVPYYLHLLDPVAGAAHFAVAEDQARRLMAELAASLPGYAVPRLARELPGGASKLVLCPDY
ncbi:MAG: KamA family radical SAM protein [Magnetococcus sp. WYHC-3]